MVRRTKIVMVSSLILIFIIILTIVIVNNYNTIYTLYVKYTDPKAINVIFFKYSHNKLTLLQNVSVSIFAFYPTSNGTVIRRILVENDTGYVKIPLSSLTIIAEHWIKHYGYNISPSLLGFASYTINEGNQTIAYIQPFTITISPYNITHGIGKTVTKLFIKPRKITIKRKDPTTTTTTVPQEQVEGINLIFYLNKVWFYPSNKSLGIIPLSVVYMTDTDYKDYAGTLLLKEGYSQASGIQFKFGVLVLGYPITISGFSITTSASNLVVCGKGDYGKSENTNFLEIYTMGQIAFANYSVYYYCPAAPCAPPQFYGYCDEVFLTGLEVVSSGSGYLPGLYNTTTPNVPPSEYFSNNLTFIFSVNPTTITNAYTSVSIYTSNGFATYSVPISLIIKIAELLGETIPSWLSLALAVVSPYVGIVAFTNSYTYFASTISITDLSSNTYYVYLMNSSIPYCISGEKYYIPYYYYYINYTS
ncbi:hypothetical protein [Sulfurisphaera tokodaii]|uniref:Uncharacterized protein n=2 Tax=Sulfurisphaera tokodaii TaxID=111955 RepID=Q972Y5_SULTO|nr:hypothetical protein [Sulfurisphaera tokodaii]BAB66028.1 hypothetical protein STK_10040 [Sulfurisphaera tokodaii str. 7]HII73990.1 hypothetical protein [Sulfurisphaera tokodaii]